MSNRKKNSKEIKGKNGEITVGEKKDMHETKHQDEIIDESVVEPGDAGELEQARQQWEEERADLLDKIKRKQADIDNLRRISKQEQTEAREYALHEFLCRLLPVVDNIERGLEAARADQKVPAAYSEGLEMIHRQLMQILEQEDVCLIDAVGELFDPNCHHAIMQVESDQEQPGTVLEELQKGYRHRQRILRPSMVKVCKE